MYRVIVTGGRTYDSQATVNATLDEIHAAKTITHLIQGGARVPTFKTHEWMFAA